MSLITGDMKDEVAWSDDAAAGGAADRTSRSDRSGSTTPATTLTANTGPQTKAWRFDTVGVMTPLADEKPDHE